MVSWETIAMMIAGWVKRVQPVSAKSIAKQIMSTFGAKYTSTKLQPTINEDTFEYYYAAWEEGKDESIDD